MGMRDAVPEGRMATAPGLPGTHCLTWRRPHGLQVTCAIGRLSPTRGVHPLPRSRAVLLAGGAGTVVAPLAATPAGGACAGVVCSDPTASPRNRRGGAPNRAKTWFPSVRNYADWVGYRQS